jgi:hypothetical protein
VEVLAGEDAADPGHGGGRAGVDGADAGVGERAADHAHPQGARDLQVVHEAGLAREQPCVLLAEQPAADRPSRLGPGGLALGGGHAGTSSPAAASTALTMLW